MWLALSVPDHTHYAQARKYWDGQAQAAAGFCSHGLGAFAAPHRPGPLGPRFSHAGAAWRALQAWLALPTVQWLDEPAGIDEWLRRWAETLLLRRGDWTDAYLAGARA